MSWIEWLNSNHGLISAIATVVIAFFAIITAWLTKALANENRLMRKSDTEPLLSWHQRTGALVPLLFYVHSVEIGYGYLAALSWIFLGNVLDGPECGLCCTWEPWWRHAETQSFDSSTSGSWRLGSLRNWLSPPVCGSC